MNNVFVFRSEYDGDMEITVFATREACVDEIVDACRDSGNIAEEGEEFQGRADVMTESNVRHALDNEQYVSFRCGSTCYSIEEHKVFE